MTYKIGSVFDVSFHLFYPELEADDDFDAEDDDVDAEDDAATVEEVVLDGELVQVTVICESEMSLPAFVAQLDQVKLVILKDKGFIEDEPVKVEIVEVKDISQQDFAVLPACENPDEEPVRPGLSVKLGGTQ